jgi:hypothetical protein
MFQNVTQSTNTLSGAVQVYGGVGVGGNLYVGGIINIASAGAISSSTNVLVKSASPFNSSKPSPVSSDNTPNCIIAFISPANFPVINSSNTIVAGWNWHLIQASGAVTGGVNTATISGSPVQITPTPIALNTTSDTMIVNLQDFTNNHFYRITYIQGSPTTNGTTLIERLI